MNEPAAKSWPDYRAVWRWHFYAGLFCIPFVIVLSLSGAMYLFKPQVEAWNDAPYDNLTVTGSPATAEQQTRAALAALPGSTLSFYELPTSPNSAVRVVVRQKGEAIRVYLHPETLKVLHTFPEQERFMRFLFRLHGELLMGDRGSMLVELAASWTILLIVTGLYLWWPRNASGMGGVAYPRWHMGSRILWRDLHSVTGVWVSTLALILLLSGLPWAKFWGSYFKSVRQLTQTADMQQDWTVGAERPSAGGSRQGGASGDSHAGGEHAAPARGSGRRGSGGPTPKDLTAIDRIVNTIQPLGLQPPVQIAPPASGSQDWTAKSMTANRPWRVNLVVNGTTGAIVSREDFKDRHLIDQIVGTGIALHEGQLFGWPNQLLGLLTAAGLLLLCVSSVVLWWRRRDQGVLGAPKVLATPRVSVGLGVLTVLFAVFLPLFGASLLLVLLAENLILSRIPVVSRWLGLRCRHQPA